MEKHPACIATQYGWVEIDNVNFKAVNCVVDKLHDNILQSEFYKSKENEYWPAVNKLEDYDSTFKSALSYYETEYFHHILRYPEFTPTQFKEALMFLLEVCEYCYSNGYYIRTHLWNLTFVRGKPLLIDIRDFEIYREQNWVAIFKGHFRDAIDTHNPVLSEKFVRNSDEIKNKLHRCPNDLKDIRVIVESIVPVDTHNGTWTNYHGDRINFLYLANCLDDALYNSIKTYGGGSKDPTKSLTVMNTIEMLKPKTVVEVGCNNGLYCFAAAKHANVVGIDYDINAINNANEINKKLGTNATFLCCDLLNETNNSKSYGQKNAYGSIYDRCRSELLIAPAVMHHLYRASKDLDKIARVLSNLAVDHLLVEHIPGYYNEDNFLKAFEACNCIVVDKLSSSPSPRVFYLFSMQQ